MEKYLDLGLMPLSNNLCDNATDESNRYPLQVLFCNDCGLSQLSIVVDPNTLFKHYVYRSSISQGYKDHCRDMAVSLRDKYNLSESSFHIDIAGNDGALLEEFKKVVGGKVLNIDPAKNLVPICEAKGIRMFSVFFNSAAASHLIGNMWQKADLITATNVFAHVDDVKDFLTSAKMVATNRGVIVLEFPYLIDFIDKQEFDTVYFEHLSYFSISPLRRLCESVGLWIEDVEKFDIHGGTVRVIIRPFEIALSDLARRMILAEKSYMIVDKYKTWEKSINKVVGGFSDMVYKLKRSGLMLAGFAASAKGNTLLNCAGLNTGTISYIVDETPEKIGKYSPGTGIPIVSMEDMTRTPPDYLVILSWNFADEIIEKCKAAGYTGKFILPLTGEVID